MLDAVRVVIERVILKGRTALWGVGALVALVVLSRLLSGVGSSDFRTVAVPADHDWPPPGWVLQNPSSTSAWNAASFVDEHTGWLVGTNGVILATKDGGQHWQHQTSGTDRHLLAVMFINERHGWIAGEGAVVLHTEDGGATWIKQDNFIGFDPQDTTPEYLMLSSIAFADTTHGWITGSGWVRTVDAGGGVSHGGRSKDLIFTTEDGGRNWQVREWTEDQGTVHRPTNGKAGFFRTQRVPGEDTVAVNFLNETRAWAVGRKGIVYASVDGGQTWTPGFQAARSLINVCFADQQSGWAIGEYGVIIHTGDGGATWQQQESGVGSTLRGVTCIDGQTALVIGQYGLVLKTKDGGAHWEPILNATTQHLRGVAAVEAQHAWAVGNRGTIVATTDGGMHWQSQISGIEHDLEAVTFVSATQGWVVGDKGTILATSDGGQTWRKQGTGIGEALRGVSFVDENQGWAAGTNGAILTTQDGGKNWVVLNRGGGAGRFAEWHFFSVSFLDPLRGWVVGQNGTILRSRDGGRSWDEQWGYNKRGNVGFLSDASFPTRDYGWAVGWQMLGGQSVIMATDDGGESWDFQSGASVHSGHSGILRGVKFINKKVGWAVGGQGTILKTTNGGRVWTKRVPKGDFSQHRYSFHYNPELYAVTFIDAKTGWVVGENGTILRTDSGGE